MAIYDTRKKSAPNREPSGRRDRPEPRRASGRTGRHASGKTRRTSGRSARERGPSAEIERDLGPPPKKLLYGWIVGILVIAVLGEIIYLFVDFGGGKEKTPPRFSKAERGGLTIDEKTQLERTWEAVRAALDVQDPEGARDAVAQLRKRVDTKQSRWTRPLANLERAIERATGGDDPTLRKPDDDDDLGLNPPPTRDPSPKDPEPPPRDPRPLAQDPAPVGPGPAAPAWITKVSIRGQHGKGTWQLKSGVLVGSCTRDRFTLVFLGDQDWVDYEVSFEARAVAGNLFGVFLRGFVSDAQFPATLQKAQVPTIRRDRWYAMRASARGSEVWVEVSDEGKKRRITRRQQASYKSGVFGFALPMGGQAAFRNIRARVYRRRSP